MFVCMTMHDIPSDLLSFDVIHVFLYFMVIYCSFIAYICCITLYEILFYHNKILKKYFRYAEVREMYINIRNSSIKYAVPLLLDAILLQVNRLTLSCKNVIILSFHHY